MSDEPVDVLREAFLSLLPTATADRAALVLRKAIAGLVVIAENHALAVRGPPVDGDDLAAWHDLKARLRDSGVGNAEIARQLDMSKSSINQVLAPNATRAPSRSTFEKLSGWLDAQEAEPEPVATPEPAPLRVINGHVGPGRLSIEQRDKLAGFAQLDEQMIRRDLGMTRELMGRAIAGAEMPGEAVERITAFLATAGR
jgi:hypothetical protein